MSPGAILLYLAEKTGLFLPTDLRGRKTTTEWLFWQMGGLGPMAGQNHHFSVYAPEKIPYAINRYVNETNRLYGVIDRRLADRPFLVGDAYTIADMAAYPVGASQLVIDGKIKLKRPVAGGVDHEVSRPS